MAMFGWTDPRMPAHYIARANREQLRMSGMDKIIAFDQSQSWITFCGCRRRTTCEHRRERSGNVPRSHQGLEGLLSKRRDRPYQAGRSKFWAKVKNRKTQR
jgi:hypothetical protein